MARKRSKRKSTKAARGRAVRTRGLGTAYRSLVQHAVYGIYRSDRDGRFLAVNPALVEMLGYGAERELLKLSPAPDIYSDPQEQERLMERCRRSGHLKGVEMEWKRKDGTRIAVRLSGRSVADAAGAFDGFEMMVEDVSERRALEAQLQQAQKMEAIGQLTGGIAHDFNNLLTVIVANADLLRDAVGPRQPELQGDLDDLRNAARRGAEMARKLLGFSRRGQLTLKPVNLTQVVAEAVAMLRRLLPEHVEVRVYDSEETGTARADVGAIEQILMNLVTNARDAMPQGGILRIETRRGWLDEEHRASHGWGDPGEYAVLIVSDTGAGMDAATRQRVFEPFFTTKAPGSGTGLGMAMVYGLVKQHGGFIDVSSELAQGTTVKVYVPATTGPPAATARRSGPHILPGGSETILIAENEEVIRRSATRILEGRGYRVLVAADGQEALDRIREPGVRVDLVVTDIGMPRLSGPELYHAVRGAGLGVPFLFMSAYTANDLRESDRLDPALPFLHKPWTLTELARRVREVLDQAAARAAVHGRTILVVDDDDRVRTILRKRLEAAGCRVTEAADGASALERYRQAPADLVMTDLVMPGKTGHQLIAELRREFPRARVIAMSGSLAGDRAELLGEAERGGAIRTLPKPFTTGQLLDAVRAALREGEGTGR